MENTIESPLAALRRAVENTLAGGPYEFTASTVIDGPSQTITHGSGYVDFASLVIDHQLTMTWVEDGRTTRAADHSYVQGDTVHLNQEGVWATQEVERAFQGQMSPLLDLFAVKDAVDNEDGTYTVVVVPSRRPEDLPEKWRQDPGLDLPTPPGSDPLTFRGTVVVEEGRVRKFMLRATLKPFDVEGSREVEVTVKQAMGLEPASPRSVEFPRTGTPSGAGPA